MKNITQTLKIITLAFVLSVGISYVSAWTAPTATPPNSNVAAPINVGSTAQTKVGNIGASWIYAYSYRDAGDPTDSHFIKPNGDSVLKKVIADTICFGADCKTAWPAGGVTSINGSGAGISVAPTTGAVTVANTGVTSLAAGGGISISGSTGAVTISSTGGTGTGITGVLYPLRNKTISCVSWVGAGCSVQATSYLTVDANGYPYARVVSSSCGGSSDSGWVLGYSATVGFPGIGGLVGSASWSGSLPNAGLAGSISDGYSASCSAVWPWM